MKEQPFYRCHRKGNTEILLRLLAEKVIEVDPVNCTVRKGGKDLKITNTYFNYPRVVIWFEGKTYSFYLHKIIWVSVNGAVPNGFEIDHIGDSKAKPSIDKLRLLTWEENLQQNRKVQPAF